VLRLDEALVRDSWIADGGERVLDGQPLLVFSCHTGEQGPEHLERRGPFSTWDVLADDLTGPWDLRGAHPFEGEPKLFAAPLVQQRDGGWAFVGFRNQESEGVLSFEILDPIPVAVRGGVLERA
jgi:beta-fructofuranosidase